MVKHVRDNSKLVFCLNFFFFKKAYFPGPEMQVTV